MSEYWVLQKKEKKKPTVNPVATINITSSSAKSSISVQCSDHPLISSWFLLVQETDTPIPIKILHDTCSSQSLSVEGVLPSSNESATDDHILIKGVELGFISVLLYLKSDLISGYVTVDLPVKGASFLFVKWFGWWWIDDQSLCVHPLMFSWQHWCWGAGYSWPISCLCSDLRYG